MVSFDAAGKQIRNGAGASDDPFAELEAAAVAAKLRVDLLWDRAGPWRDVERAIENLAVMVSRVMVEMERIAEEAQQTAPRTQPNSAIQRHPSE